MKDDRYSDRLLDDLAEEVVAPGFRQALLERALGKVRRRRRVRRGQQVGLFAALILGLSFVVWQGVQPGLSKSPLAVCRLINTQALSKDQVVETRVGAATITYTSHSLAAQFSTVPDSHLFLEFSDAELLAFLEGKPVVLVSSSPLKAELIFLNPVDAEGFELP